VHAIIFDRTDPISPQQGQRIHQKMTDLRERAPFGKRFDIYTVEGDTKNVLTPVRTICSPNRPEDANVIYEDPEAIKQKYEEGFVAVLEKTIDQRGAFKQLKKELTASVESKTGENFASPAEGIQKGLFVPASHLSKWMSRDWSDIERNLEEAKPDELDAFKKEFCRKKTQLQLVIENSRADDSAFVWNARDRGWDVPVAKKRPFVWNYDSGDGLPFYFIPVEFLP